MEVKIEKGPRNDRHYVTADGPTFNALAAAAKAVAKSSGCDYRDVEFKSAYGNLIAEVYVSITSEEYAKRNRR